VENYPGFPDGIDGFELGQLIHRQATKFGLVTIMADATGIELQGKEKVVITTKGNFTAKAVIIAAGTIRRKLGIPGEEEFTGKGVSYCATCDAPFFRDKPVAVVGGDNTAISEALHLAKFASRVTIIHRRDQLRVTRSLQEKVTTEPKIDMRWNAAVDMIIGTDAVTHLKLHDTNSSETSSLETAGVFISIGLRPNTDFIKGLLSPNESGQIVTNEKMETAVPGVFAVGDIRSNSAKQAITAAGDGATAAIYAEEFISG
jgi:thioredoxin reductase (NADPH)